MEGGDHGLPRNDEKLVPGAEQALDRFKWEIADDLGLAEKIRQVGWENMTTKEMGMIGGQMVRRMIAAAEESLRQRAQHEVTRQSDDQPPLSPPLPDETKVNQSESP